nr:hypothetical protein [Propionicimonas sp.]
MAALQQVRDAAGELDDLEAAGDLAEGVRDGLAVLGGDDLRDPLPVGVEQLAEREQHPSAPGHRGGRPADRGLGGPGYDLVDQVLRGQVDRARLAASGRVEHRGGALGRAGPVLVADQVGDALYRGSLSHDLMLAQSTLGGIST